MCTSALAVAYPPQARLVGGGGRKGGMGKGRAAHMRSSSASGGVHPERLRMDGKA